MTKELPDNGNSNVINSHPDIGGSKVINGRMHVQNANGNYELLPISMDEARNKQSLPKNYVSEKTQVHIQKAADLNVGGGVKVLSSTPGIAYGVVDIAAGEKISGVAALAGSAPNYVKGKVEGMQGNIERVKAAGSFVEDIKGLSLKEKGAAASEFIHSDIDASKQAAQNEYDNLTNGVRGIVGATKDISGKTAERRLPDTTNIKSANSPGVEFE